MGPGELEIWEFSERELSEGEISFVFLRCCGVDDAAGEGLRAFPKTRPRPKLLPEDILIERTIHEDTMEW